MCVILQPKLKRILTCIKKLYTQPRQPRDVICVTSDTKVKLSLKNTSKLLTIRKPYHVGSGKMVLAFMEAAADLAMNHYNEDN